MKIAPLIKEMNQYPERIEHFLIHTGQHYDRSMSDDFFEQLDIPTPNINLGIGSDSHAVQTARIMIEFEKVLLKYTPDLVVVVGDVNSTVACSLVAVKLGVLVAHVEAGLRSFDRSMPEEINRLLTDSIADFLFITEESAKKNLIREGINKEKIFFVGNTMIDTLLRCLDKIKDKELPFEGIQENNYAVITIHRPSNVDNQVNLKKILDAFYDISKKIKLVIPLHPRTKKNIEKFGMQDLLRSISKNSIIIDPIGYLEMLRLNKTAKLVITDSGGLQEETTYLGIPCITIRENTERPSTINIGTNILVGNDINALLYNFEKIISGDFKNGQIPPLWDGKTAHRIVQILLKGWV